MSESNCCHCCRGHGGRFRVTAERLFFFALFVSLAVAFLGLFVAFLSPWPGASSVSGHSSPPSISVRMNGVGRMNPIVNPSAIATARHRLHEHFPKVVMKGLYQTPSGSVYLMLTGRGPVYITTDFRFMLTGHLYDLSTGVDETRVARAVRRVTVMLSGYEKPAGKIAHDATPPSRARSRPHRGAPEKAPKAASGTASRPAARNLPSVGHVASAKTAAKNASALLNLSSRGAKSAGSGTDVNAEIGRYKAKLLAQVRHDAGLDGYSPKTGSFSSSGGPAASSSPSSAPTAIPSPTASGTAASGTSSASPDSGATSDDSAVPGAKGAMLGSVPRIGYRKNGTRMSAAEKRAQVRRVYRKIPMSFTVNFPAYGKSRGQILVFSDYSCPYCERLDKSVPTLNRDGVTVRYVMFPRVLAYGKSNPDAKHEIKEFTNAWCAMDQQSAFKQLYETGVAPPASCKALPKSDHRLSSPVLANFALGELFGIKGTPTIVYPDGTIQTGYPGVSAILKHLGISTKK